MITILFILSLFSYTIGRLVWDYADEVYDNDFKERMLYITSSLLMIFGMFGMVATIWGFIHYHIAWSIILK
jgi:hypothetical protein